MIRQIATTPQTVPPSPALAGVGDWLAPLRAWQEGDALGEPPQSLGEAGRQALAQLVEEQPLIVGGRDLGHFALIATQALGVHVGGSTLGPSHPFTAALSARRIVVSCFPDLSMLYGSNQVVMIGAFAVEGQRGQWTVHLGNCEVDPDDYPAAAGAAALRAMANGLSSLEGHVFSPMVVAPSTLPLVPERNGVEASASNLLIFRGLDAVQEALGRSPSNRLTLLSDGSASIAQQVPGLAASDMIKMHRHLGLSTNPMPGWATGSNGALNEIGERCSSAYTLAAARRSRLFTSGWQAWSRDQGAVIAAPMPRAAGMR